MPIIDPDQGVPLPAGTDLADNPAAFSNFYTPVLSRQNNRYTTVANRTALHPANIDGEESYLTTDDRKEINTGVAWISMYTRSLFTYKVKTANQTVNNSTALVNDADLFAPLPTAGVFAWESILFYTSTTVADIKFAYTIPAGASMRWGAIGIATGTAGVSFDATFDTNSASGAATAFGGSGGVLGILLFGAVTMGGTAGNLQMQFAQQALEVSNTMVNANSRLKVWRTS